MGAVAAVRTRWLCGSEKSPSELVTDEVRRTVTMRAQSQLVVFCFDRCAVGTSNKLTSHARLDAYELVGPVAALDEQNAIELVPEVVVWWTSGTTGWDHMATTQGLHHTQGKRHPSQERHQTRT